MFNYVGQPWKTQREVRNIMNTEYHLGANGLSGNDDSGQMSAWYIFAALGFYPVCPGSDYYVLASPAFAKAVLNMSTGHRFTIIAQNASAQNIYVQSATLNGKPYDRNYLLHSDIAKGGKMVFVMGPQPNKAWGSSDQSCPPGGSL
jgi:predicted alpha-1,2-mannosidase